MFSFLNNDNTGDLKSAYPTLNEPIQSTLGYKANNQYTNFPPKMSDGRAITASYQPEAVINNDLLKSTGITSNWHYRKYLTNNAKQIVDYNFTESANDVGYFKRYYDINTENKKEYPKNPYVYLSNMDNREVLGVKQTDLKQVYLTREQLNSRKVSPVITQEELLSLKK